MAGHGGSHDMAGMPGMDMSGGSGTATMALTDIGPRLTAGLLAAVLLVLGVRWLARSFDAARLVDATGPRRPAAPVERDAFGLACHSAMALGMAVTFVCSYEDGRTGPGGSSWVGLGRLGTGKPAGNSSGVRRDYWNG